MAKKRQHANDPDSETFNARGAVIDTMLLRNDMCSHCSYVPSKKSDAVYSLKRHYIEVHRYTVHKYQLAMWSWVKPEWNLPEEMYEAFGYWCRSGARKSAISDERLKATVEWGRAKAANPNLCTTIAEFQEDATDRLRANEFWPKWAKLSAAEQLKWKERQANRLAAKTANDKQRRRRSGHASPSRQAGSVSDDTNDAVIGDGPSAQSLDAGAEAPSGPSAQKATLVTVSTPPSPKLWTQWSLASSV